MNILFHEDNEVWISRLPAALRRCGHSVHLPRREDGWRELGQALEAVAPEAVVTVGCTRRERPEELGLLRAYCEASRAVHVHWSVEDPLHTATWTLGALERGRPDAAPTISPETVPLLRELGCASGEMPFACEPTVDRPHPPDPALAVDVALVATLYTLSAEFRNGCLETLLAPLVGGPWRVGIWGFGWNYAPQVLPFPVPPEWLRGPAAPADVPAIYGSAAVVLGPQNHPGHLTARTFEALGCGALLLTVRTPAVRRTCREGEHLLCSGSAAETVDLVRRAFADAPSRRRVGEAGRALVLAHHTYDRRARWLTRRLAAWSAAKRRTGRLRSRTPLRRVIVRAETATALPPAVPGRVPEDPPGFEARFRLPGPPFPGAELASADLECFTAGVARPGGAACRLPAEAGAGGEAGTAAEVRLPAAPVAPYPYTAGWFRFPVTAAAAGAMRAGPGAVLRLQVVSQDGLEARWAFDGWRPPDAVTAHHTEYLRPRLVLLWRRPAP